jgi:hypothetical protein
VCKTIGGRPKVENNQIVMVPNTAPQAGPSTTTPTQDGASEEETAAPQQKRKVGRKVIKKRKTREFDDESGGEEENKVCASSLYTCWPLLTFEISYRQSSAAVLDCF